MPELEFEDFFRENRNTLYRVARSYLRSPDRAEDAVLDSFMKLYHQWNRISKLDNPVGYAVRTVINTAKTILRKDKSHKTVDDEDWDLPSRHRNPEEMFLLNEENRRLEEQMFLLKEQERNIIFLKDLDGKKFEEIAGIMDMKLPTVKSIYRRAKIKLAEEWED